MADLGNGRAEPVLELRLGGLDVLALALERARFGEVELDRKNCDEAAAQGSMTTDPAVPDAVATAVAPGTFTSSEVRSTSRVS